MIHPLFAAAGILVAAIASGVAGHFLHQARLAGIFQDWAIAAGIASFPPEPDTKSYEERHFAWIKGEPLRLDRGINRGFHERLVAATGYDMVRRSGTRWIETGIFDSGVSISPTLLSIGYDRPAVRLRAFFLAAEASSEKLVAILPGYGSNALKVLGIDNLDYHNVVAMELWRRGFDVAVVDLVSSPEMAAAINARLTMAGSQLTGLQVRQACDVLHWLQAQKKYKTVVLYGLRNGGRLVEFVANLCDARVDVAIVDGTPQPWREALWRNVAREVLGQIHQIQYLAPLLAGASLADFAHRPKMPLVYLLDSASYEAASDVLRESYRLAPIESGGTATVIARAANETAVPDLETIEIIARREMSRLQGVALVREATGG